MKNHLVAEIEIREIFKIQNYLITRHTNKNNFWIEIVFKIVRMRMRMRMKEMRSKE